MGLPRLDFMASKVAAGQDDPKPRLHAVRDGFATFQAEIVAHLDNSPRLTKPIGTSSPIPVGPDADALEGRERQRRPLA